MLTAIYGRVLKERQIPYVLELLNLLKENDIEVVIFGDFLTQLNATGRLENNDYKTFSAYNDLEDKEVEYLISLGGDGTLLDTLPYVQSSNIPILGINLGRLGFLASTAKENIRAAVFALKNKSYKIDKRTLLHLDSNRELFDGVNYALNEFSIHKNDTSSMITIHTYINGELLNSYWADGLIVATPTGSTGYSLSCGGPIIFPTSENFVITPIAPHNLNVRPMVVSSDTVISFEVEGRADHFLCTLDSRYANIDSSIQLAVKKEHFYINLLRLDDIDFLSTIRTKLMWGADQRN
ncbi:MAG: NAD kinase [Chitinophagales bacterium]